MQSHCTCECLGAQHYLRQKSWGWVDCETEVCLQKCMEGRCSWAPHLKMGGQWSEAGGEAELCWAQSRGPACPWCLLLGGAVEVPCWAPKAPTPPCGLCAPGPAGPPGKWAPPAEGSSAHHPPESGRHHSPQSSVSITES